MKIIKWIAVQIPAILLCLAPEMINAQTVATAQPEPPDTDYSVVARDAHDNIWQRTTYELTPSGQWFPHIHSYVETATGLNYLDSNGLWQPSSADIEPVTGGAAATNGQHKVTFAADLATIGAISLQMPDGQSLNSQLIGLRYFDQASGQSTFIAVVTNCIGEIVGANQVWYTNAFAGLQASVRYTYTISSCEQDIVLEQCPEPPEYYGLSSSSTVVQAITEFLSPPAATISTQPIAFQSAGQMADQTINFPMMRIGPGRAFLIGDNDTSSVPVSKEWTNWNGYQVLIEQIPMAQIAAQLQTLPSAQTALAPLGAPSSHQHLASLNNGPPVPSQKSNNPPIDQSVAPLFPSRPAPRKDTKPMKIASLPPRRSGFLFDYSTINTSQTNYVFQGDTTYFISGNVNLYGTSTFEGGAVLKYTNGASIYANATGYSTNVNWLASAYRPIVFTAMDDDSVGQGINGATGNPTGYYAARALDFYRNSVPISYFRVAYAAIAMSANYGSDNFSNGQLFDCQVGIESYSDTLKLRNVLFANVQTNFSTIWDGGVDAQNATFSGASSLAPSIGYGSLSLENCILANVTQLTNSVVSSTFAGTNNGFYDSPAFGANSVPDNSDPFQTAFGGGYYLTNGCIFRNAGTTNIDPVLLAELQTKTTYPPIVYSNTNITGDTTFTPQAQRDTDTPDLGYHYDPLDWVFGGVQANNNLTFTAGTVAGWYNGNGDFGINLTNSIVANFQGTATAPDYWVRCNTVQEQDTSGGFGVGGLVGSDYQGNTNISISPVVSLNFTRCAAMADCDNHFRDNDGYLILQAKNSEFYSGNCGGYVISAYFTNCLWDRQEGGQVQGWPGDEWIMRNCTFHGGQLYMGRITNHANTLVSVRDCSFDSTGLTNLVDELSSNPAYTDYNYNAFTNASNPFPLSSTNNVVVTNFNFQTNWLGNYYLPTNSPLTNAGDVAASQVGLFYFTTHTNQVIQSNSIVDIGYHYVGTDTNGNPLGVSYDGIPEYWAAQYGLNPDASPPNVDGEYGDSDGDGLSNLQKYQLGLNPLEYNGFANPIALPPVGSRYLRIITPTLLELAVISSGDNTWNFSNSPPGTNMFLVVTNGVTATNGIQQVGFKRHPIYNSYSSTNASQYSIPNSDLRVEADLYLVLRNALNPNDTVQVQPNGTWSPLPLYWPSNYQFVAVNDSSRYGPAIHVNQEGYPIHVTEGGTSVAAPQTAIIGYYCGTLAAPTLSEATAVTVSTNGTVQTWDNYDNGPVNMITGVGLAYPTFGVPTNTANNVSGWVGFEFTNYTGTVNVTQLGRFVVSGNSQQHTVELVDSTLTNVLGSVTINTATAATNQFAWAWLTNPVTLIPGEKYYLLSSETYGGDSWYFQANAYTGGLGQADFSVVQNSTVKLIDAASGAPVSGFNPTVSLAIDNGGVDSSQYQGLLQVNFGGFSTPGEYQLQVDGLGASFPFWIGDEVPMKFARTYALGLYHERCGTGETLGTNKYQVNDLPFTRFTHGDCHTADASVPLRQTNYSTAWNIIASWGTNANPFQKAEELTNPASSLFPFSHVVGDGKDNGHEVVGINGNGLTNSTEGGHHDAGDYSKYTDNSAQFIHTLVFAADNFPNVAKLDNLGIPESGDGVSDVLQEAKWEADFLLKMQDLGTARNSSDNPYLDSHGNPIPDGGFYTLVYPQAGQYDGGGHVLPQFGDPQIVWPKGTLVTAAAVGALAEIGSSPTFCSEFGYSSNYNAPNWTNNPYLVGASNGWSFLTRACTNTYPLWQQTNTSGKDNCFQSLYSYGDTFMHNDELAWAAAAMFAAGYSSSNTNQDPDTLLHNWYPDPEDSGNVPFGYSCSGASDPPCQSWWSGWQAMYEGYGCAIRDYAFAVSSGRKQLTQLSAADTNYLAACQNAAIAWGHTVRSNAENNAYGADLNTSGSAGFGWYPNGYFPMDTAFDIAVADQLDTSSSDHSNNIAAILGSLNYEAGCNPNNVGFLFGLGWRRQRVCVNQYWYNAGHVLPPTGIGVASVNNFADYQSGGATSAVQPYFYPIADTDDPSGYALYDRWADALDAASEYVSVYGARSLATMAWLAAQSSTNVNQQWGASNITSAQGTINGAGFLTVGSAQTVQLSSTLDLSQATIVWDFPGQQPAFGPTYSATTNTMSQIGEYNVGAEAALPDGRRVFAANSLYVYNPNKGGTNFVPDGNTVALYHFDGTTNDSSGNGYNLTASGSDEFTNNPFANNTTWMASPTGEVVRFNTVGDNLNNSMIAASAFCPSAGNPTPITVEFEIYPRAYINPSSGFAYLFELIQSGQYISVQYNEGLTAPDVYVSESEVLSSSGWQQAVSLNTWHAVKITLQPVFESGTFTGNATVKLYVDTNPVITNSVSYDPSTSGDWILNIGNFNGDIDEARISNILR